MAPEILRFNGEFEYTDKVGQKGEFLSIYLLTGRLLLVWNVHL